MLWVFGDSYSIDSTYETNNKNRFEVNESWIDIISKDLFGNKDNRHVFAQYGVSNEWIFSKFFDHYDKIEPGSYVIVQTTSANRRWFFEDKPEFSNFMSIVDLDQEKSISKNEIKALKQYIKYLHNIETDIVTYKAFVLAYHYLGSLLSNKNIKMLIIPGFHNIGGIFGTLSDICFGEFENDKVKEKFYDCNAVDPRLNHMSEINHIILAERVLRFFKYGEIIDLTDGFVKNIFTEENIK